MEFLLCSSFFTQFSINVKDIYDFIILHYVYKFSNNIALIEYLYRQRKELIKAVWIGL